MKVLNSEITIVIVAYNRPKSLKRLLSSLNKAYYNKDKVRLYISIDKGDNNHVLKIAENFEWSYGEKIINYNKENLGLRNHIIQCGNLTKDFNNIIVLEDDLYVSKNFYLFTKQALQYYNNKKKVAGISLYSQRYNEISRKPFQPFLDGTDVFFWQMPSSWGQAWNYKQWQSFVNWYNNSNNKDFDMLPQKIRDWPQTSWKKYFILYLIKKNRFFVYPNMSLTTNFADSGTHISNNTNKFQVSLINGEKEIYKFQSINKSKSVYDIYLENMKIDIKDINQGELCVDLYGSKDNNNRYLLSTKKLDYRILDSYGLKLRPHENNVFENIEGNEIFLYDTIKVSNNKNNFSIRNTINILEYYNNFNYKGILKLIFLKLLNWIYIKIKEFL